MSSGEFRSNARGALHKNALSEQGLMTNSVTVGRNGDAPHPNIPHDVQVQNVPEARVYVFGDADVAEEELNNDDSAFELRARGDAARKLQDNTPKETETTLLERDISEGDTLQSISLRYGIPVAELKRINNLIRDQDFFALVSIKVPIKRYGLLTELLANETTAGENGVKSAAAGARPGGARGAGGGRAALHSLEANSDTDYEEEGADSESRQLLVRTISIRGALSDQGQAAQDFLHRMDCDIQNIVASTKNRMDTLDEVTSSLTCKRIHPFPRQKRCAMSGADCGIRWWSVVAVMFTIGLFTPLLYYVYFEYIHPNT